MRVRPAYGYWHARAPEFFQRTEIRVLEWLRLPGDILFIIGGILPVVYLALRMFRERTRYCELAAEAPTERLTQSARADGRSATRGHHCSCRSHRAILPPQSGNRRARSGGR